MNMKFTICLTKWVDSFYVQELGTIRGLSRTYLQLDGWIARIFLGEFCLKLKIQEYSVRTCIRRHFLPIHGR